ncbi:HEAT repeat domain-containing protein [Halobacterium litoreum]|uniref:HEAT repeat domain-containing protein n=1 Tax=Halobacterium litoreum TaxID=2039234 RepID=A0ABD5NAR7_9EURY|nr:HEAT repeat domain-containing protein [Halobacterium litoreum]UHH12046.1 protein kinase [Halobacterium litoreum]
MDPDTAGREVDSDQIAALRGAVDADGVESLVEALDSDDADVRAGAAWRLVESATSEPTTVRAHLDSVVECVSDDDVWVRRGATWVLAELAEEQPDALSVKFSDLVELTRADDPLVRQNGVVAVAGVTKSYPARATAGLTSIAPLTRSEDALLRRYAKQAVREVTKAIAERADDAGYPMLVRAHPAYAELFPEGVSVVTTTEDEQPQPVYVSFGEDAPKQVDDDESSVADRPPEDVPAPPDLSLSRDELDPNMELREGVLTTDHRAAVDEDTLEHGLVTFRRLHVDDPSVRSAFRDGVDAWAAVDGHDHVMPVLGRGDDWVATQYDDGATLDRRGAPETLRAAVWTAGAVTKAVSHAHARGVVHGGLHPGAVRFVDTGSGYWDAPVVGGWGFAHAASAVYTPPVPDAFAAPEHREPETYGRFDQATDVFGLGAVTYFLLTGERPVTGGELVPATRQNPALPASADDLFALSVVDEKPGRFDTVLDFQRALDGVAADVGGEA